MMKYGRLYADKIPQLIEDDVFKILVSYPDYDKEDKNKAQVEAQAEAHVKAQAEKVLNLLIEQPRSAADLVNKLNLKEKSGSLKKTLGYLLQNKLIEYLVPDKITSPKQQYRITSRGKELLKKCSLL